MLSFPSQNDFFFLTSQVMVNQHVFKSSPTGTILAFHNALILMKSVNNKNKNEYYCHIILELR